MKKNAFAQIIVIIVLLGGTLFVGARILKSKAPASAGEHGEEAAAEDKSKLRGPHGGRFFVEKDIQGEVQIYEPEGVPPQFHLYFFKDGKPVDPQEVKATITLERINRTDTVNFKKEGDYLAGDMDVVEPHSFHAKVAVQYAGKSYEWRFDSIEGRAEMADEILAKAGVEMVKAGPAKIRRSLNLRGRVRLNEQARANIVPRFAGVVKQVKKELGDMVQKGDVLATIESNESLQQYEVKAEIAGTVIEKSVALGEAVTNERTLFIIADLSTVWVDFTVYRKDFTALKVGQPVTIDAGEGMEKVEAKLTYLSPFSAEGSQTMLARSLVPNPKGELRPGMFVLGDVVFEETEVPIAVKASALQTFRDWDVVFIRVGKLFEAVPIEIGRRDAQWVEVKEGLPADSLYAADNSFIIKADVMKGGATHDH